MKHIGIVAVTMVGAATCANTIVAEAAKIDPSGKHPEISLNAFSFDRYKKLVLQQNWNELADIILESISKLEKIGADFIIIPSNTPHYGYARIHELSPLPVLNLIDITVKECIKNKYQRVAVLGTSQTMNGGLYANLLNEHNIIPVIPKEATQNLVQHLIMDEIIPSRINPASVENLKNEIQQLDCDAVILGCTELPEVYNTEILAKPAIDTTRLLAKTALDFAIGR